ncbi:MAG: phosphoribosyl-AMP cyclohydrolase [Candidatus Omnitrophica bacterium]|nr:phosphoribosyl-AMP cyclohydrolase [Candidatus Omnitrophota bacterium]
MKASISKIPYFKFDEKGLIVAIVQDVKTRKVLMVAYMNKESLKITLKEKRTCFYSRSRQCLWRKGDTSGNIQKVKKIYYDCDKDALLIEVDQKGAACHTGEKSCFFRRLI